MKPYFRYDMPWRPAYEINAAIAWTLGSVTLVYQALNTTLPMEPFVLAMIITVPLAVFRWMQAIINWEKKIRLYHRRIPVIPVSALVNRLKKKTGYVFLGWGFKWLPKHTQRTFDLITRGTVINEAPKIYRVLRGVKVIEDVYRKGNAYIHGIETAEEEVYSPIQHFDSHTLITGATGAGKTRLLELLITAAVLRGEAVLIIDPKSDRGLRDCAKKACRIAGRTHAFQYFHPAFSTQSVRLDPLHNFNRVTEIASRIASLIPSETGNDPFAAFGWRALNIIASAMIEDGRRPNIAALRELIEGGADNLLLRITKSHFERHIPGWEDLFRNYVANARKNTYARPEKGTPDDVVAAVQMYKERCAEQVPSITISGMINMFSHSRDHMSKLLASLYPVLDMLVSGDLAELLSPDPGNAADPRPILDSRRIIEESLVLYVGLDSLSDGMVGSAIGSILIADLTSYAADRYNYSMGNSRVNIFIDEAAEVISDPAIQLLNKSRGSGYSITLASQGVPDFIARTGSEPKAQQCLANVNTVIALRTKDTVTQEFIVEKFGTTMVKTLIHQMSSGSVGRDITTFGGGYGERQQETEVDLVSAKILGELPDLEYYAHIVGGEIIKGRLPFLDWSKA